MIFDPQIKTLLVRHYRTLIQTPLGIAIDSFNGQVWIAEGIGKIANIDPAANLTIHEYAPSVVVGGERSTAVEMSV